MEMLKKSIVLLVAFLLLLAGVRVTDAHALALFLGGQVRAARAESKADFGNRDNDRPVRGVDNSKNVADRAVSLMPELFDKVSELFSKKDKNPPDSAGQEGKPQ